MTKNLLLGFTTLFLPISDCDAFAPASRLSPSREVGRSSCRPSSTACPALLLEGVGAAVDTFFQTQPYMSAFLTCSVKASAADLLAQKKASEEDFGEEDVDVARNLAFIVYGGFYQGCAQQFIYNDLFPLWFGTESSVQTVLSKVMAEMIVFGPMVCLPIAYTVKSAFTSNAEYLDIVKLGLGNYFNDVMEKFLLFRYWGVWFPAHCLTFSVIPEHFRIAFVASISFFWVVLLSSVSSQPSEREAAICSNPKPSTSRGKQASLIPAPSNQF